MENRRNLNNPMQWLLMSDDEFIETWNKDGEVVIQVLSPSIKMMCEAILEKAIRLGLNTNHFKIPNV